MSEAGILRMICLIFTVSGILVIYTASWRYLATTAGIGLIIVAIFLAYLGGYHSYVRKR